MQINISGRNILTRVSFDLWTLSAQYYPSIIVSLLVWRFQTDKIGALWHLIFHHCAGKALVLFVTCDITVLSPSPSDQTDTCRVHSREVPEGRANDFKGSVISISPPASDCVSSSVCFGGEGNEGSDGGTSLRILDRSAAPAKDCVTHSQSAILLPRSSSRDAGGCGTRLLSVLRGCH